MSPPKIPISKGIPAPNLSSFSVLHQYVSNSLVLSSTLWRTIPVFKFLISIIATILLTFELTPMKNAPAFNLQSAVNMAERKISRFHALGFFH